MVQKSVSFRNKPFIPCKNATNRRTLWLRLPVNSKNLHPSRPPPPLWPTVNPPSDVRGRWVNAIDVRARRARSPAAPLVVVDGRWVGPVGLGGATLYKTGYQVTNKHVGVDDRVALTSLWLSNKVLVSGFGFAALPKCVTSASPRNKCRLQFHVSVNLAPNDSSSRRRKNKPKNAPLLHAEEAKDPLGRSVGP